MCLKMVEKYRELFMLREYVKITAECEKELKKTTNTEAEKNILQMFSNTKEIFFDKRPLQTTYNRIYNNLKFFKKINDKSGIIISTVYICEIYKLLNEYLNAKKIIDEIMDEIIEDVESPPKDMIIILVQAGSLFFEKSFKCDQEEIDKFYKMAYDYSKENEICQVYTGVQYIRYLNYTHNENDAYIIEIMIETILKGDKIYKNYWNFLKEFEIHNLIKTEKYEKALKKTDILMAYYTKNKDLIGVLSLFEIKFSILRMTGRLHDLCLEANVLYFFGEEIESTSFKLIGLEEGIKAKLESMGEFDLLNQFCLYDKEKGNFLSIEHENTILKDAYNVEGIKLEKPEKEMIKFYEEISQQKDKLIQGLYHELKSTQEHIISVDKLKKMGELAASICHDLNTPIGAIESSSATLINTLKSLLTKENSDIFKKMSDEERNFIFEKLIEYDFNKESPVYNFKQKKEKENYYSQIFENNSNCKEMVDILMEFRLMEFDEKTLDFFNAESGLEKLRIIGMLFKLLRKTNTINTASQRMSKSLGTMKIYSRFEQREFEDVDVILSIERVISMFKDNAARDANILTDFKVRPIISGFQDDLSNVWTNIIQNAIYAIDYNGNIIISSYVKKDYLYIEFENDGEEIPESIIKKMFSAFFTTKPIGKGSGLGLNICKNVCIEHGGSISVKSSANQTVFTVKLPLKYKK